MPKDTDDLGRARYAFRDGRTYCRHGLILYGHTCAVCEREALTTTGQGAQWHWFEAWSREFDAGSSILFESPPCKPFATGFDRGAPGGDKTAYATYTVGKRYEFTVEDLEAADLDPRTSRRFEEMMRRHEERIAEAMGINGSFWRPNASKWRSDAWVADPPWGRDEYHTRDEARRRFHAERKGFRIVGDHTVDMATQCCDRCGTSLKAMSEGLSPRCGQEVIVSSADQRGMDAKPARVQA